jgi:hypothetical protein
MPVPRGFREEIESARLTLRALYRAVDRLKIAQELPPTLRRLFEIDADLAEALWVLDQPPARYNLRGMVSDTRDSLDRLPSATKEFFATLKPEDLAPLEQLALELRARLRPEEAYLDVPGRDPSAPSPGRGR